MAWRIRAPIVSKVVYAMAVARDHSRINCIMWRVLAMRENKENAQDTGDTCCFQEGAHVFDPPPHPPHPHPLTSSLLAHHTHRSRSQATAVYLHLACATLSVGSRPVSVGSSPHLGTLTPTVHSPRRPACTVGYHGPSLCLRFGPPPWCALRHHSACALALCIVSAEVGTLPCT